MKKITKIVSLVLALALAIGATAMPAFAADTCYACSHPGEDYYWTYNADGTVKSASWRHACGSKGPYIFGNEDKRSWATKYVQNGSATVMYYMDADGGLWTDMPEHGGTFIGAKDSDAYGKALYGATEQRTWYENYERTQAGYAIQYEGGMGKPDTSSAGFTDVPDNAWYAKSVNALANAGILHGYGKGKFGPNDTITWEQVYYVLFGLLGLENGYLPKTCNPDGVVTYATKVDVVNQFLSLDKTSIGLDLKKPINRAQATELVALLYSLSAMNFNVRREYTPKANNYYGIYGRAQQAIANGRKNWTWDDIPDGKLADSIGHIIGDATRYELIPLAYTVGIVKGVDGKGTLNAAGSLTRAEFCQMLYNAGILGCMYPEFVSRALNTCLYDYMLDYCTDGAKASVRYDPAR